MRSTGPALAAPTAAALIDSQLARRDGPCGHGFGGYAHDRRIGAWDERRGRWRR